MAKEKDTTDFAAMKKASEAAAAAQIADAAKMAGAEMQPKAPGIESINAPSDHSANEGMVAVTDESMAAHRAKIGPSRGAFQDMPHGEKRDQILLAATKKAGHKRVDDDYEITTALTKAVVGVIHKRRRKRDKTNPMGSNTALKG